MWKSDEVGGKVFGKMLYGMVVVAGNVMGDDSVGVSY